MLPFLLNASIQDVQQNSTNLVIIYILFQPPKNLSIGLRVVNFQATSLWFLWLKSRNRK